jgi:hypothetical protein
MLRGHRHRIRESPALEGYENESSAVDSLQADNRRRIRFEQWRTPPERTSTGVAIGFGGPAAQPVVASQLMKLRMMVLIVYLYTITSCGEYHWELGNK